MGHRFKLFALTTCVVLASAPCAFAQMNDEVTVNPNAGGRVLLYPGGKYTRVQQELLQPGEADPNAPIVLHMPRKHRAAHHAAVAGTKPSEPAVAQATPKRRPPRTARAKAAPTKQAAEQPSATVTSIPDESATNLFLAPPPKPAPKTAARTAAAPHPQPSIVPDKPMTVAHAEQPPPTAASEDSTELSKRSSILFSPGAEEPPPSALDTVRALTASLTAALWSGTAHVQLEAFGGKPNDKSSDARRLSLKRALIVRQLLIDDGIPSEKIVVRAMGGASAGAPDRVDIFVAA